MSIEDDIAVEFWVPCWDGGEDSISGYCLKGKTKPTCDYKNTFLGIVGIILSILLLLPLNASFSLKLLTKR